MAGATTTTMDAVLKDFLVPLESSLADKVELWDEFQLNMRPWTGRQVIQPLHLGRNVGAGTRPAAGTMPGAGAEEYKEHKIAAKYVYGRIKIDNTVLVASAGNNGAFVDAVTSEIEGMSKQIYKQLDRMVGGDGSGSLGVVKTTGTVTNLDIKYAGAASSPLTGGPGTRFIQKGMKINIGTAVEHAAGTATNATVASKTNRERCVIGSTAVVADDIIVLADSAALVDSSYNNDLQGFEAAAVQTGAYQNITVTDYTDWMMYVSSGTSSVNRTLEQSLMQDCIDRAEDNGGEIDLIIADRSMRQSYLDMVLNDKRYAGPKNLDAGYIGKGKDGKDMDFNGIPFKFVRQFPYNRIAFLDKSTWSKYPMGKMQWLDKDGAILSRVSGEAAFEALLFYYLNFGCKHPGANAYLKDITVTLPQT